MTDHLLDRYRDLATRLAERVSRGPLELADLRVLAAYLALVSEDAPPPDSRCTRDREEAMSPPKGSTFAFLPLAVAQSKPEPDLLLAGLIVIFFAYVASLLWRRL